VIRRSRVSDERVEAPAARIECWCLHGAVGHAGDWRTLSALLAQTRIASRAIDLWRFADDASLSMPGFAAALHAEALEEPCRAGGRLLVGYSMGGRLALHALLGDHHPWQAAVIISAHPGLESESDRAARRAADREWAARAITSDWNAFLEAWNAQAVLGGALPRDEESARKLAQHRQVIARRFIDWSLGAQAPLWDRLAEIQIPVLWVAGDRDAKFLDLARRAVDHLPAGRLAVVPGAGHRVPWDAPDVLAVEVAAFADLVAGA